MTEHGFARTRLLVAMVLAMCGSAADAASASVGVVAEYRPAAGRFEWRRPPQGTAVPVRIGGVVTAGDEVVLRAGDSITLHLSNGERLVMKGPGTRTVPAASSLGSLSAVFESLSHVFDDEFRLSGTAASRGSETCRQEVGTVQPIQVPILASGARVIARLRDIPLAWRGGCPPFAVVVRSPDGTVLRRESVEGWQVRVDELPLVAGRYSIRIVDASGREYQGSLEAMASGPTIPRDLAADGSAIGITAQAMWLAGQDGGRWRIDGFEMLRPLIRAGDPLAGSLGDGLLWGADDVVEHDQRPSPAMTNGLQ